MTLRKSLMGSRGGSTKRWLAPGVLAVLMLAVGACTDDQYAWWERQGGEISDEVVRDFCAERLEYCSNTSERLTAIVGELKGKQDDSAGASSERSVKIEWGESHYAGSSTRLSQPYSLLCSTTGPVCWTLRYELEGDWGLPPFNVYCLTDGKVSQEFILQLEYGTEPVGCVFIQPGGRGPTGSAQVVIDGVWSNILPSRD